MQEQKHVQSTKNGVAAGAACAVLLPGGLHGQPEPHDVGGPRSIRPLCRPVCSGLSCLRRAVLPIQVGAYCLLRMT